MSKRWIKAGATDQTVDIFIADSSSTTGAGLSGLVFNSAGLACYYRKGATGSATALTLATQTVGGAHSDGGFVEIQATNMKGVYRLDLSDTIVDTAGMATIYLYGATNMAPVVFEIEVVSVNIYDTVRMGLTALPNAAADGAGGLPISDAGGLDLDTKLANTNEITVARMGALTDWINGGRLDLIIDDILVDTSTTLQAELDGIQADTEDIQTRLPAALVSGRIDASVGAMAANVLTAAAIATDAITAAKIAADAIGASELATDAVTEIINAIFAYDASQNSNPDTFLDYIQEIKTAVDTEVATIVTQTTAAAIRTALGLASANLDTQIDTLPTAAEVATALLATALSQVDVSADTTATVAKALLGAWVQAAGDWSISGTTLTIKNPDGTTFRTFTLDSGSAPTSRT